LAKSIDFRLINESVFVGIKPIKHSPHLWWDFSFANPSISIFIKIHQAKTATARSLTPKSTGSRLTGALTAGEASCKSTTWTSTACGTLTTEPAYDRSLTFAHRNIQRCLPILSPAYVKIRSIANQELHCFKLASGDGTMKRGFPVFSH